MRSNAWTWVFSSTHNTTAASGGFRYKPTTSRTLSMNCGSVDSLKSSIRWGFNPNVRQIREIAVWFNPTRCAIDLVDHCVEPSGGASSKVVTMTCSTMSSVIFRGWPGRGSSSRPSRRLAANRVRHLPTVTGLHRNSPAMSRFSAPSAAASTIRHRNANACPVVGRQPTPATPRAHHRSTRSALSVVLVEPSLPPIVAENDDNARHTPKFRRTTDSRH